MQAMGSGSLATARLFHRRRFLVRTSALAAAGLLAHPLRLPALQQSDAAKPPQPPLTVDEKITKILVEHLGVEEKKVVPAARLKEDLGADSLDVVEIVMAMEEAFDLEISDELCDAWKTVADIRHTIHAELEKEKAATPN